MTSIDVIAPTAVLDHALGVELQLIEAVAQRAQATAEGRSGDVIDLTREIAGLQLELASTAEKAARPAPVVRIHDQPAGDHFP